MSPSDSLIGAHAHAISTRPSFLPRGAGSEAMVYLDVKTDLSSRWDFPFFLWHDHTHPTTTPTSSIASVPVTIPSPPPSAAQGGVAPSIWFNTPPLTVGVVTTGQLVMVIVLVGIIWEFISALSVAMATGLVVKDDGLVVRDDGLVVRDDALVVRDDGLVVDMELSQVSG